MRKVGIGFLCAVALAYFATVFFALLVAYRGKVDWLIVLGALWLGVFLGILLGFYVQEAEEWNPRAMGCIDLGCGREQHVGTPAISQSN
jgi:uncharacterized membrane protein YadS